MQRNRLAEMMCVVALLIVVVWIGVRSYQTNNAPVVGQSTEGNPGTGVAQPDEPMLMGAQPGTPMFVPHSIQSTDRNGFGCPVTWETVQIGGPWYMNVGHFDKYIVAAELAQRGHVWLYDYTPPGEYIEFVDTRTGNKLERPVIVRGPNGTPHLGFHHRSIYKPHLEVHATYQLSNNSLALVHSSITGDN